MIYPRMLTVDGKNPSIDTDAAEFHNRINWACDMLGLPQPVLIPFLNMGPLVAGSNVASGQSLTPHAALQFTNPKNNRSAQITIEAIDDGDDTNPKQNLQGVLAYLSLELGLGLTPEAVANMIYTPPEPPKHVEDWEAPGTLIGPPLESAPGWFTSLRRGNKPGDTFQGISGATYRYGYVGGQSISFMRYPGWERIS